jgi:hypothetical protein
LNSIKINNVINLNLIQLKGKNHSMSISGVIDTLELETRCLSPRQERSSPFCGFLIVSNFSPKSNVLLERQRRTGGRFFHTARRPQNDAQRETLTLTRGAQAIKTDTR